MADWQAFFTNLKTGLENAGLKEAPEVFTSDLIPETVKNANYALIPKETEVGTEQVLGGFLNLDRVFELHIYFDFFKTSDIISINAYEEKVLNFLELEASKSGDVAYCKVNNINHAHDKMRKAIISTIAFTVNYDL